MRHVTALVCPSLLLLACQAPTAEPGTLRAPSSDASTPAPGLEASPVDMPEAALVCSADADCGARDACSVGRCDAGRCVAAAAAAGAACQGGACDGAGHCAAGESGAFVEIVGKGAQTTDAVAAMGEAFGHDVIVAGTYDDQLDHDDLSTVTKGGRDGYLRRVDRSGAIVWQRTLGGAGDLYVKDVAVDRAGHVIVAGCTDGDLEIEGVITPEDGLDAFVASYDDEGELIWTERIGGFGRQCIEHIAADRAGRVFAAGTFDGYLGLGDVFADGAAGFVASFDPAGGRTWQYEISSPAVRIAGLDLGDDGSVYLAGTFRDGLTLAGEALFALGGDDGFVAKLGAGGSLAWLMGVGGTGDDVLTAATATGAGVAIAGTFHGAMALGPDVIVAEDGASFVAGFAPDGSASWSSVLEGDGTVVVTALAQDRLSGSLVAAGTAIGTFVAAHTVVSADDEDAWVAKLAYDGTPLWLRQLGGEGTQRPTGVVTGEDGLTWLTGTTADPYRIDPDGSDLDYGWLASFGF